MNCINHPDREHVAFCQNCGKPLCQECVRPVGNLVFCEPCLAARIAGVPRTPTGQPFAPPSAPGEPSPALAAVLGFLPGVGAMYNDQYAKGIVHLIVFAILISLADANSIFGLFIAGWVFYQVIEAHHTAQARRDGTPLPNPFGLNDLGERLGFNRAWPTPPAQTPPTANVPPIADAPPVPPPYSYNYTYQPPDYKYPAEDDEDLAHLPNRFPAGAIWLIGLGIFFLLGNLHVFGPFRARITVPMLLIAIGVWAFVRRMTTPGPSFASAPGTNHQLRTYYALRGSVWVILIGVLLLLDNTHILRWHSAWPMIVIAAGVMMLYKRATFASLGSMGGSPYTSTAPPPAEPGTSIVPTHHNEEL